MPTAGGGSHEQVNGFDRRGSCFWGSGARTSGAGPAGRAPGPGGSPVRREGGATTNPARGRTPSSVVDGRADPVELLESQAATRVPRAGADPLRPDARLAVRLLPRRGADHGRRPGATPQSGLRVQLCGDAHLSNFGIYASPERRLVFDINDFDETYPGPFEWDVKRLAASLAVAGRCQRVHREEARASRPGRRRPATARRSAASPGGQPGRLVLPPGHGRGAAPRSATSSTPARQGTCAEAAGQGAHPRQRPGAGQADHRSTGGCAS